MQIDYKQILKEGGITTKEFSSKIGISYDSFRSLITRGTPKWIKALEIGYKIGKGIN